MQLASTENVQGIPLSLFGFKCDIDGNSPVRRLRRDQMTNFIFQECQFGVQTLYGRCHDGNGTPSTTASLDGLLQFGRVVKIDAGRQAQL